MSMAPDPGFGLYIHWPFCQSKCPYCDFNSHVAAKVDQSKWLEAYLAEIERAGTETNGKTLQSIFFGGGTPSLMDPEIVGRIIDSARRTWPMSNAPEITLEANPTSVEAGRFAAYGMAGVNRVSIGVQALNDVDLRRLGRMHSANEALKAIEIARSIFSRVNFDLIYARQGQGANDWRAELQQALQLGPTHLSLYQLTIEEGTVFYERQARGQLDGLPDEDLAADMFLMTQDLCAEAGLPAYEVSNHAVPGEESRHNATYWRGGDYVGIGPGAHGRLTLRGSRVATECIADPAKWMSSVQATGSGELPRTELSREKAASEYLLMGLRMYEGIHLSRFSALSDKPIDDEVLQHLELQGMIRLEDDRIKVTDIGMPILNLILRDLVPS
jgi:putative oxygen-independent coproporphyrinogen III oxidase